MSSRYRETLGFFEDIQDRSVQGFLDETAFSSEGFLQMGPLFDSFKNTASLARQRHFTGERNSLIDSIQSEINAFSDPGSKESAEAVRERVGKALREPGLKFGLDQVQFNLPTQMFREPGEVPGTPTIAGRIGTAVGEAEQFVSEAIGGTPPIRFGETGGGIGRSTVSMLPFDTPFGPQIQRELPPGSFEGATGSTGVRRLQPEPKDLLGLGPELTEFQPFGFSTRSPLPQTSPVSFKPDKQAPPVVALNKGQEMSQALMELLNPSIPMAPSQAFFDPFNPRITPTTIEALQGLGISPIKRGGL
jgi:hypothetical protein